METIKDIWFENERIYMLSSEDRVYSRPLEVFPLLKEATQIQRNNYTIVLRGEALRWEALDEDVHISSFYKQDEPNRDNEVAKIFRRFPQLSVSEVARSMGISKNLLSKYIYGVESPSRERVAQIKDVLSRLGRELMTV